MDSLLQKLSSLWTRGSMNRDILLTSFSVVVGRVLGFLVPFFVAAVFGTSDRTDAFFLAFGLTLFFSMVIGYIFETVIVPMITDARVKGADMGEIVGAVMVRSTFFVTIAVALLVLGFQPALRLTTHLSPEIIRLSFVLMAEMVPIIYFTVWTSAFNGALNAYKSFHVPALSPGFRSLIVIAGIFYFGGPLNVHAISIGFSVGEFIRLLISSYYFTKEVGRLKVTTQHIPVVGEFFKSAFYQTLGFCFFFAFPIVNQVMASWLGSGEISVYAYAERLRNVPFILFATGAVPVALSHWANRYSRQPGQFLWSDVRRSVWFLTAGSAVVALGLVLMRDSLAGMALGRGEFPTAKIRVVSNLFALMLASLPFEVMALLCTRILVIFRKDKLYMIVTLVKLILIGVLNYPLMRSMGILGIGVSVALMSTVYGVFLCGYARHLLQVKTLDA